MAPGQCWNSHLPWFNVSAGDVHRSRCIRRPMAGPALTTIDANDWPVLSRLLDAALLLPLERRAAWIDGLEGEDVRLKVVLRELLAKDGEGLPPIPPLGGSLASPAERVAGGDRPADGDVTQPRASTERAATGQAIGELGHALGRFVGGLSDVDELRGAFRDYLRRHPEQREAVSRWLSEAVQSGRVSTATLLTVRDLIASAPKDASPASPLHINAGDGLSALVEERAEATRDADRSGLGSTSATAVAKDGELQEGSVLDGRYTLVTELGRGGMGTVFKARDRNREDFRDRHPYIALKVLSEEFKRHPDARMALQRETARAQRLAHPNIITVYDFDYDGPHAYMTMELLEGQTLDNWLQAEAPQAPFARRWYIVRSIGAGLAYAHEKGVVHSDLKPGNVFLCKRGAVKVMDFGIARPLRVVTEQTEATRFDAGERLGALTPAYASIEQWNHEAPDPRDDIYAYACVVYFVFGGRHPFDGASARTASETKLIPQRIDSLSRRQWNALRHSLALQRRDRIASVDEFLRKFAPRTWWQKYWSGLLGVATLIAAALLFFGSQSYRVYVEDDALNAQLWPRVDAPRKPLTPVQQRDIDDFLYLAENALHQAANAQSVQEVSAILLNGDNSVHALLKSVRELDPSNAKALKLTSDAAHVYASAARSLLNANRLTDAFMLVGEGQTFQHTRELLRIKRDICSRDAAVCASN
jgi:serine/threonine protein kinase